MANHLLIGTNDKTQAVLHTVELPFLLIDDGPIADAFAERFPQAKVFDPHHDSFNPLQGMTHKQAREFARIVYTAAPEGETTLTVRNGKRAMPHLLLQNSRLDKLKASVAGAMIGTIEAMETISDLLFSPTLKRVLCADNFHIVTKRSYIIRLNRADIGDDDALIIALLLIGQTNGHQVIVPDAGFYLKEIHTYLVRQNRLTAGINFLAELRMQDVMQNALIGIKDKIALSLIKPDADELVSYWGNGVQPTTLMEVDSDEYLPVGSTSAKRFGGAGDE